MLTFSLYQGLGRFPIHLNNIFFMINLLLPGTSVIYYGDEIGMSNNATDLKWSEVQDPYTTNSLYCNQTQFEKDECICRDPSRTPMQVTGKFKTLCMHSSHPQLRYPQLRYFCSYSILN